jgi:hypothetical protein
LGLQIESDGRRTWALGRDSSDPKYTPDIGALVVDKGSALHFRATSAVCLCAEIQSAI